MKEKIVIGTKNQKSFSSVNEKNYFKGSEGKFENVGKNILPEVLFNKDAQVFKFNLLLTSSFDDARADLMVIANDYSYYGIIEVEISNHSLERHVLPQMKSIMSCDLSKIPYQIYDNLKKNNKNFSLDRDKIIEMIANTDSRFFVVTEEFIPSWEFELAKVNIEYSAISVFRDKENEPAFYFKNGRQLPKKSTNILMTWQKYCFELKTKDYKYFENNSVIDVNLNNEIKQLEVYRKNKKVSLFPKGFWEYDKLEIDKDYSLQFVEGFFNIVDINKEIV